MMVDMRRLAHLLVVVTTAFLVALGVVLVGPGSSGGTRAVTVTAAAPAVGVPRPDHVVVVMLENKHRTSVIGSDNAPYLNSLAADGANMAASYGVTHPSQPNYIALFSGSQNGFTTNQCKTLSKTDNLGRQLLDADLSFAGYSEGLPEAGFTGCNYGTGADNYERKHAPWVSFDDLPASVNRPFSDFPRDFSTLPTVSFVIPNMCNDMHNCSVRTGDAWVQKELGAYATWARSHNSLLIVTADENAGGTVNQIPTIIVGEKVRPGTYSEPMNHYTLLRTFEDAYGLPALANARLADPLRTIWTSSPSVSQPASGLVNGGFELGVAGWSVSGTVAGVQTGRHGGSFAVRAGSASGTDGSSILSQTFTVPAGRTRLTAAWKGRCEDKVNRAWASIVVKRHEPSGKLTALKSTCINRTAWRSAGVAVKPGQKYTVQLISRDDGRRSTPNRSYFDDVRLS